MKKRIIIFCGIILLLSGAFIIVRKISNHKNDSSTHNLTYTISFGGIKCITPVLYLYDDNTYQYYDTYQNGFVTPVTGKYHYDINKIIDNIDKSEQNELPYYITDTNGNKYTTSINNQYLKEFLTSINKKLDQCATIK